MYVVKTQMHRAATVTNQQMKQGNVYRNPMALKFMYLDVEVLFVSTQSTTVVVLYTTILVVVSDERMATTCVYLTTVANCSTRAIEL